MTVLVKLRLTESWLIEIFKVKLLSIDVLFHLRLLFFMYPLMVWHVMDLSILRTMTCVLFVMDVFSHDPSSLTLRVIIINMKYGHIILSPGQGCASSSAPLFICLVALSLLPLHDIDYVPLCFPIHVDSDDPAWTGLL